jgi:hypothetical protein
MQTLIVLSIGITLALGCFALGYGVFITGADTPKLQQTAHEKNK